MSAKCFDLAQNGAGSNTFPAPAVKTVNCSKFLRNSGARALMLAAATNGKVVPNIRALRTQPLRSTHKQAFETTSTARWSFQGLDRSVYQAASFSSAPSNVNEVSSQHQRSQVHIPYATWKGHTASEVVTRFIQALNGRDRQNLCSILSEGCTYTNLAFQKSLSGRQKVAEFYEEMTTSLPRDCIILIDNFTDGDPLKTGLVWHLQLEGLELPMSRGVSFYELDASGHISAIMDSPQHLVQAALPLLSAAAPMLRVVPLVIVRQLTSMLGMPLGGSPAEAAGQPLLELLASLQHTLGNPVGSVASWLAGTGAYAEFPHPQDEQQKHPQQQQQTPLEHQHGLNGRYPPGMADRNGTLQPPTPPAAWGQPQHIHRSIMSMQWPASPYPAYPRAAYPAYPSASYAPPPAGPYSTYPGLYDMVAALPPGFMAASDWDGPEAVVQAVWEQEEGGAPVNLSGLWEKDMELSDSEGYDRTLDLLQVSGLQKTTAKLIEGLQLEHTSEVFAVSFVTIVPFFKVKETMRFDGPTRIMRRDLRSGVQTASVFATPNGVVVRSEWGKPLPGAIEEQYELQPDGLLRVTTHLNVEGQEAGVVLVYRRSARDRDAMLRESRQRNNSR